MILRAAAVWFLLLLVAVSAGALRTSLVEPRLGEARAHLVGTLGVVLLFAGIIFATVRWIDPALEPRRLWLLGGSWLLATVVFEFVIGHWVFGHSWSRLLADYDLTAGRVWPAVLLTVLLGPRVSGAFWQP